jgi:HTH-type transcriptional repressor of NAD biosynthesis genes
MRDLGDRRLEMYNIFRDELMRRRIPYIPVSGDFEKRESIVREHVDKLLKARR